MLVYILILIALGGGVAGWVGYRGGLESRELKARMASRNRWLRKHAIAKETGARSVAEDAQPSEEKQP